MLPNPVNSLLDVTIRIHCLRCHGRNSRFYCHPADEGHLRPGPSSRAFGYLLTLIPLPSPTHGSHHQIRIVVAAVVITVPIIVIISSKAIANARTLRITHDSHDNFSLQGTSRIRGTSRRMPKANFATAEGSFPFSWPHSVDA